MKCCFKVCTEYIILNKKWQYDTSGVLLMITQLGEILKYLFTNTRVVIYLGVIHVSHVLTTNNSLKFICHLQYLKWLGVIILYVFYILKFNCVNQVYGTDFKYKLDWKTYLSKSKFCIFNGNVLSAVRQELFCKHVSSVQ